MKTIKVHVVEDDRGLSKATAFFLKEGGVTVSFSTSGADAAKEIIANAPDVVLLDILLPDKSGLDVLEEARRAGYKGAVIILTNFNEQQIDVPRATALGIDGIFVKANTDFAQLPRIIQLAIQSKQAKAAPENPAATA